MKAIRLVTATLAAACAIVGIGASSALAAAEGPFFRGSDNLTCQRVAAGDNGDYSSNANCLQGIGYRNMGYPNGFVGVTATVIRIGEGKELPLVVHGKGLDLRDTSAKVKVECKEVTVNSEANLDGSTGKNAGTGEEMFEFSGCKGGAKEESLSECEPEGGKITTGAAVDTLGYSNSTRTGKLLMLIKPKSESTLASIKFTGAKCLATSTSVSGSLVGEDFNSSKAVEVGANEVEALKGELHLTESAKTIWTEKEGSLTSTKANLEVFSSKATLTGEATLELANGTSWGILT